MPEFEFKLCNDLRPFVNAPWDHFEQVAAVETPSGIVISPFGDTLKFGEKAFLFTGNGPAVGKTSTARAVVAAGPKGSACLREDTPTLVVGPTDLFICESGDLKNRKSNHGFQEILDGTAVLSPVAGIFVFLDSPHDDNLWDSIAALAPSAYAQFLVDASFSHNRKQHALMLAAVSSAVAGIPCFSVGQYDSVDDKTADVLAKVRAISEGRQG